MPGPGRSLPARAVRAAELSSGADRRPLAGPDADDVTHRQQAGHLAVLDDDQVPEPAANPTSAVRWSATSSLSGSWPDPTESRMSRSVRIPIPACPGSLTTAAPTRWADISLAASRSVWAGPTLRTTVVMPSRTLMDSPPARGPRTGSSDPPPGLCACDRRSVQHP